MRRFALTFALALFGVLLAAAPAQAVTFTVNDGFENNPLARWSFSGTGNHHGNFDGTNGTPRTGFEYANIWQWDAGWSAVQRNVSLPGNANCNASAWFQTSNTTARVNLEIIDPATWTYISLNQATAVPTGINWQKLHFGSWHTGKTNVVLRMALIGSGTFTRVKIDDVQVVCTY